MPGRARNRRQLTIEHITTITTGPYQMGCIGFQLNDFIHRFALMLCSFQAQVQLKAQFGVR